MVNPFTLDSGYQEVKCYTGSIIRKKKIQISTDLFKAKNDQFYFHSWENANISILLCKTLSFFPPYNQNLTVP